MDRLIDKSKINISQTIFSFYFRNTIIYADWMFTVVRKLFTIKDYSAFFPKSVIISSICSRLGVVSM